MVTSTNTRVQLNLQQNSEPKFLRACTSPFALKSVVEADLQRPIDQGILEQTALGMSHAVRKRDGSIRLCEHYRSTVNVVTCKAVYPLLTVAEVLSKLRRGEIFSTLDLAQPTSS